MNPNILIPLKKLLKAVFYGKKDPPYAWSSRRRLKLICLLSITVLPLFCLAQEYGLSGKVITHDDVPVAYANVILLAKDSTTVGWDLTDEAGKYKIDNIKPGEYVLKIKSLGYKVKTSIINIDRDIPEHIILLEQQMLDEVVVTQPRIEQKTDRVVFNVQNTVLSNGNVWNALSQAPYLMDSGDGLLVKGREVPIIYINGKRSYLSQQEIKQLLESTPANLIKSVEIILAPPASFDAEGGTIVNIVMSKNLSIGYNGNINGSYEQGVYPKYRIATGHFYKTDKLNLYAGYSYNNRKTYRSFEETINFFTDDIPSGEWFSNREEARDLIFHNINTNIDYTINSKHSIGLSANASIRTTFDRLTRSYTEAYDANREVDSSFYSTNRSVYPRHNVGADLDYKYDIDDNKELRASMRYTTYGYDQDQTITTDYFNEDDALMRENAFTNDKEQNVDIYIGQADYSASSEKSDFEAGVKWTHIGFDNEITQENIQGDNIELFDTFLYDETNLAAYMSYEQNWEKWDMKLGLRGENTVIKGVSVSESQTNEQNYFKVFPTVYITYKASEDHNFNLSYVKKIERPRFNQLNPFRIFLNDNAYITGNPNLLPKMDHRLNLKYTHKRWISFTLYMYYLTDPIENLPFVDNQENQLVYIDTNIDKNVEFGLDIIWDRSLTSWWYMSSISNVFYYEDHFFAGQNSSEVLKNIRWGFLQILNNSFTFSKTFRGNIRFLYLSDIPSGNLVIGGFSNLSAGLQKTFWNRKATLSLSVNDILGTRPTADVTQYRDQYIRSFYDYEFQTFEIGFTYRFGNYRLRTNKKSIGGDDERDRLNPSTQQ